MNESFKMLETKSHTFRLASRNLNVIHICIVFLHFTWELPPARIARQLHPPTTTPARPAASSFPSPTHYIDAHYYALFQKLAPIIESKQ